MTNVAIIPARGGSKGLPGKNIADLAGKPLIVHTIQAAQKSGIFDRIVVTTDDVEIFNISQSAGAEVIRRPGYLAQDNSSSLDVILHTLEALSCDKGTFCLLQPTSPLRTEEHIHEAYEIYSGKGVKSVVSASELSHHPLKTLISDGEGGYRPIRSLSDLVSPRQALPEAISPNGAIYFCDVCSFTEHKELFFDDTVYYKMDFTSSVDVDDLSDLERCRELLAST